MHSVQVDERVAPSQHPDRHLSHLCKSLLEQALLRPKDRRAGDAMSDQHHAYPLDRCGAAEEVQALRHADDVLTRCGFIAASRLMT
jgi:hypothetical protein